MNKYLLFGLYLTISLLIGEFHPFSRYPMYSSFPNYAYVFYLSNEKEEIVPFVNNFGFSKNANFIAAAFYSISNHNNYTYGFGNEKAEQLQHTGKEIMDLILYRENTARFDFDTLKLYRRHYFIKNSQIHYTDKIMHEKSLRP